METVSATAAPGRTGLRPLPCWVMVVAGTALFGSVSLVYPYGRDQGTYAYIAQLVLDGRVMYRDILMGMGPLTVLVHLLARLLFGPSMTALRVLDLAWTAATALLVHAYCRRAFASRAAGLLAGLLYAGYYYLFDYWNTAQVDGFLNLPVAAAFVLLLPALRAPGEAPRHRWLAVGALLGVASLFKYTAGLLLPALGGFVLVVALRTGRGRSGALWLAAGFGAVWGVLLAGLAAAGAFGGFSEPIVNRTLSYAAHDYLGEGALGRFGRMFRVLFSRPDQGIAAALGFAGLAVSVLSRFRRDRSGAERRAPAALWCWFGVALLAVYLQGRLFYYHYLPLLPALAAMSSLALTFPAGLLPRRPARRVARFVLPVVAGVVLLTCTAYPTRFRDLGRVLFTGHSLEEHWRTGRYRGPDFFLGEQLALAEYLRAGTEAGDRVFVWGADPLVNLLADRRGATRFIYNHHLVSDWTWPGLRREFIRELESDVPEVMVVVHRDATPWVTGHDRDSYQSMLGFDELRRLVTSAYEVGGTVGRFDVLYGVDPGAGLPDTGVPPGQLRADLAEVLAAVGEVDASAYRSVLWPLAIDSLVPGQVSGETRERFIGYGEMMLGTWLGERSAADYLPALSVWITGDRRPFAGVEPFCWQSEAEPYIAGGFRFTPLYVTADRAVVLFLIDDARAGRAPPGEP